PPPAPTNCRTNSSPMRITSQREQGQGLSQREREQALFPIVFFDVHFAYEGGARPALRGVSLALAAGETVALVGPSGAGKSTLAYLLLRFLEPDAGTISAAGRPLADWSPAEWRRFVAYVPQHPHLFAATLAENVRLARPAASAAEVARALSLAGCDDFLPTLPQGLETPLGERGARLSGGQAQRLALARAFLKDSPLLVLDEPLANLDPAQAAALDAALARLQAGRATLVIAHRLGTARRAERVLVLADGRLAQQGRHEALLAADGLYARLVAAGAAL
ncbi:MAG: ABC transporter ATP-binding protein, partial [Chloroflexota bacterium]